MALTIPPRRFFSRPFDHLTRDYVMARDYLPRERPGILGVSFCTLRGLREKYVLANSLIFSCLFFFFFFFSKREYIFSSPPLPIKCFLNTCDFLETPQIPFFFFFFFFFSKRESDFSSPSLPKKVCHIDADLSETPQIQFYCVMRLNMAVKLWL